MRKIMAPLVIVNMMLAMAFLGYAIMVSYSGNYKAAAKQSDLQKQVTDLTNKKKKLNDAAGQAPLREQGLEFIELEVGKSASLLRDIEAKRYAVAREPLNKEIADRRKELADNSEENLKSVERDLFEKLKAEKELRTKIVKGRADLAEARKKNDEREGQKAELENRLTQQGHLLDVARGRAEQVAQVVKQFESAAAAGGGQ